MKILILANTQQNVEMIKAEIPDLGTHEVYEVNDVIDCHYHRKAPRWPLMGISWKTDNLCNKVDEMKFDVIFVYKRFIEEDVQFPFKFEGKSFISVPPHSYVGEI